MQTQTKLQHSPFIRVKSVYRSYTSTGESGVKPLGDHNTWMININRVTRIKDCGYEDLIINNEVVAKVPVTKFFFGFPEDEGDEQATMGVIEFEAVQELVACWEFTYNGPEEVDDETTEENS